MKTKQIQKTNNSTTGLSDVYDFLKGLDLLEPVSGYEEMLEDSWNVEKTLNKKLGEYSIDIVLYARWEKDDIGYGELVDFSIEDVTVYDSQANEVLDTEDCLPYMNNPMYPTFEKEQKGQLLQMLTKLHPAV